MQMMMIILVLVINARNLIIIPWRLQRHSFVWNGKVKVRKIA